MRAHKKRETNCASASWNPRRCEQIAVLNYSHKKAQRIHDERLARPRVLSRRRGRAAVVAPEPFRARNRGVESRHTSPPQPSARGASSCVPRPRKATPLPAGAVRFDSGVAGRGPEDLIRITLSSASENARHARGLGALPFPSILPSRRCCGRWVCHREPRESRANCPDWTPQLHICIETQKMRATYFVFLFMNTERIAEL